MIKGETEEHSSKPREKEKPGRKREEEAERNVSGQLSACTKLKKCALIAEDTHNT